MKKILLIENDNSVRTEISDILKSSNFEVVEAPNGKEGIEKALSEQPDLILCDTTMPLLDGYGVLHVLSRHPETFYIPFIFLGSKQDLKDLRQGMNMGADDYILKPANQTDLLSSIEVRLKKFEGFRRTILPTEKGIYEFIAHANQSNSYNLMTNKHEVFHFKKKHILYSVDQRPMYIFFVKSGRLKEYMVNERGKEFITNIYTQGDFFGYIDILQDGNYQETVQVMDDADLIHIPKSDFLQLINNDRHIAKQFIGLLSQNIRSKEAKLLNLAYNPLRKKVAVGIIEIMDKFKEVHDGKPMVKISREDLANVVGSAQESMIRTLREFKTEKLIDVIDGNIYILNEKKLRSLFY
jgi:CRP/FNR family cyclic AMP-dependent transcriptional regulator